MAARNRKWADVDEDDEEGFDAAKEGGAQGFVTAPDEHGIKTAIDYTERDGKTYKASRAMRVVGGGRSWPA